MAFVHYQPCSLLMLSLLIMEIIVGLCIPTSIVAVKAAVRPPMIGIATATSGMFRTLGGSLGIALMSAALFAHLVTDGPAGKNDSPRQLDLLQQAEPALLVSGFQWAFIIGAIAGLCALLLALTLQPSHASRLPVTGEKP